MRVQGCQMVQKWSDADGVRQSRGPQRRSQLGGDERRSQLAEGRAVVRTCGLIVEAPKLRVDVALWT